MYRQSPSRNQRSKGVKVKYVVQICLLLAVCFWLIYQVKHSHDKKKEFEENEAKDFLHLQNSNGKNLNLGRKGIYDKATYQNGDKIHEPIEEEETIEEENKPEEDENKSEEDENKLEGKEQEEKNVDHKQENPDDDENEAREVDFGDGRIEGEKSLLDESEHNGDNSNNNNKSKHEAREENYKADDASSAVTHEAQTGAIENVNEHTENLNKKPANKMLEEDNKEVRKDFELEGGEIAGVDQKSNLTISEMKVDVFEDFKNGSPPNDTLIIEISSRDLTSNDSAEVKNVNRDSSETKPELDHDPQDSGLVSNLTDSSATKDADLQHYGDFSNSSNNNTDSLSSDSSLGSGNKTESLSELDEIKMEKTDGNDNTYETSESTANKNPEEEIQQDNRIGKSDAPVSHDEKHVLTDLDALPEIHTEGTNSEDDVAAE